MEIRPDHVHLIIDVNPRFGIMECVRKLKGASARTLRKEFPALKSRLPSLWTRSAFISSVGAITLCVADEIRIAQIQSEIRQPHARLLPLDHTVGIIP